MRFTLQLHEVSLNETLWMPTLRRLLSLFRICWSIPANFFGNTVDSAVDLDVLAAVPTFFKRSANQVSQDRVAVLAPTSNLV